MNRCYCAFACILALVPPVAGTCPTSYYRSYSYSYPVSYSYPTYTPYYAPPVQKVIIKEKIIPVAAYVPTPLYFATAATSGYAAPTVGAAAAATPAPAPAAAPAYAGPSQADWKALVAMVRELKEDVGMIKAHPALRQPPSAPAREPHARPPASPPEENGGAAAAPGPASSPAAGPPPNGTALLGSRCASCHETAAAKQKGGGIVLFDKGVLTASPQLRLKAVKQVLAGKMPMANGKPAPLPDAEGGAVIDALSN